MRVMIGDSLTKVLREPDEGAAVLREPPARLRAACNERASFQVVIEATRKALRGVTVTVSDLEHTDGVGSIAHSRAQVNPVGYVETGPPAYEVNRTGWWPDPLLPPRPSDVEQDTRQPFWVTVHVPQKAAPGVYTGAVTISAEGTDHQVAPVELRVWDFALAPTPPLPSAVAIYPEVLARWYGQERAEESTLRSYWDMLFTHRLSSDEIGEPLGKGIEDVLEGRDKGPWDYTAIDRRLRYCFRRGLTAFQAARLPGFLTEGPDLNDEQQQRAVAYLRDYAQHLEASGWLDRAFVMVWDEPRDHLAEQVRKELEVIHRAHPRLRGRLDGPVTGPLVERCEDQVDTWGLHMMNVVRGGSDAEANIRRWRERGNVIWLYVACDTHHPYPNVFIDYPLMDCRVLPWLYWRYGIEGFLYWSANFFGEANLAGGGPEEKWPNRPWVAANFVETWSGGRREYNGDGQLVYPGPEGTALSSLRLEALRDGMQDYEYLWLLRRGIRMLEATGLEADLASEAARWLEDQPIARTFDDWCRDPAELLAAREELGALLERVLEAARP